MKALDGKKIPLFHVPMTVSSLALGSFLTICENVARAAALCDLEAPGWGALVSALCFC